MAQIPFDPAAVTGKWHLLREPEDEINVPDHRLDLVFRAQADQLNGPL
jgi:hypothetical protein